MATTSGATLTSTAVTSSSTAATVPGFGALMADNIASASLSLLSLLPLQQQQGTKVWDEIFLLCTNLKSLLLPFFFCLWYSFHSYFAFNILPCHFHNQHSHFSDEVQKNFFPL
jgi:hypothetical protein